MPAASVALCRNAFGKKQEKSDASFPLPIRSPQRVVRMIEKGKKSQAKDWRCGFFLAIFFSPLHIWMDDLGVPCFQKKNKSFKYNSLRATLSTDPALAGDCRHNKKIMQNDIEMTFRMRRVKIRKAKKGREKRGGGNFFFLLRLRKLLYAFTEHWCLCENGRQASRVPTRLLCR